jgi:hypothetical protein
VTEDPYKAVATQALVKAPALQELDYIKAYAGYALVAFAVGTTVGSLVGMTLGSFLASAVTGPGIRYLIMLPTALVSMFINYFVFRFFVGRFIVPKLAP